MHIVTLQFVQVYTANERKILNLNLGSFYLVWPYLSLPIKLWITSSLIFLLQNYLL
jgi:hypothetical protein